MLDGSETRFIQAINVFNAALTEHADTAPYAQLIDASEKLLGGRTIGVAVYDAAAPADNGQLDYFTMRFVDGNFELVSHGLREPEIVWKVSHQYLEEVAKNPQVYIDHPLKLDWDWLKSRLGFEP